MKNVNKKNHKQYLAVIPARGGSKRLPGKNLLKIGGHSLIGCALNSVSWLNKTCEICVTTDDQAIANEALKYGPYVHFMRPEILASDSAKTYDVVCHAIRWFQAQGKTFDYVIVLQPTSPLRTKQHVLEALHLLEQKNAQAVVSVCALEHPVEWCAELGKDGAMENFGEKPKTTASSQELLTTFRLNGAIYIYNIERLIKAESLFYNEWVYAYIMDMPSSVDIDTYDDYNLAVFYEKKNYKCSI